MNPSFHYAAPSSLTLGNQAAREGKYELAIRCYELALREMPELTNFISPNISYARRMASQRSVVHAQPIEPSIDRPASAGRVAIAVHVFHIDLWREFEERLTKLNCPFDLYVMTTLDHLTEIQEIVSIRFPLADVRAFDSAGFDIVPFLRLVPELAERGYGAVCNLHAKKSDGGLSAAGRNLMLDALLASDSVVSKIIAALEKKEIAFAGPSALYQAGTHLMYKNEPALSDLARRVYGQPLPSTVWGFFAGMMFWCDPSAVLTFARNVISNDGELLDGHENVGKLECAVERMFGLLPHYEKRKIGLLLRRSMAPNDYSLAKCAQSDWIGSENIDGIVHQVITLESDADLLRQRDALDLEFYRKQVPLPSDCYDPYIHYLLEGTFKNFRPAPFFIPDDYREANPDVVRAKREPLVHYLLSGIKENRRLHLTSAVNDFATIQAKLWLKNRAEIRWSYLNHKLWRENFVSIVVPMFNNGTMTVDCIKSIKQATRIRAIELIIVDNGSNPTERALVEKAIGEIQEFPCRVIVNPTNYNFAVGCNLGFAASNGDIVVFLNNDTTVTDGWIDKLVAPLSNEHIGAVQPKLLYPDGTVQCAGIVFATHAPLGYPIYAGESGDDPKVGVARIYQAVTAACVAMRSKDFAKLQGFDPTFINGQEDIDLCLRLKRDLNLDSFYTPAAVVYHYESKTPSRGRFIRENRVAFIERWSASIVADDNSYYLSDMIAPREWREDSAVNARNGIAVYRPTTSKVEQGQAQVQWDLFVERTCVARLNAAYSARATEIDNILVTICMPVYNRASLVIQAIRSVQLQTHVKFELIVCDDGSTDGSQGVVEEISRLDARVKLIKAQHAGVSAARNRCLEAASGEFVFYLDSDNQWEPEYLRRMITFMRVGRLAAAYCALKIVGDDPRAAPRYLGKQFDWLDCFSENFIDLNIFGHSRVAMAQLRFDENLKRLVDWDFILAASAMSRCAYVPFVGARYYNGKSHERITTTVAQGALVRMNQHLVRCKHRSLPIMEVMRSDLRPRWDLLLPVASSALTVQNWAAERSSLRRASRVSQLEAVLRRISRTRPKLSIRIKVPAPNLSQAKHWGDYHFAQALAEAFSSLGHQCNVDCLEQWAESREEVTDVVIALRGLSQYIPQPQHINILWLISHPDKVTDAELELYDHVVVASDPYANLLADRLHVPVSVLHQAVDPSRFRPELSHMPKSDSVLFVGNSRNIYRRIVKDAVEAQLPLEIFGRHWNKFVDSRYIKGEHVENYELGKTYACAGVVLNDHWDDMRNFGFISNRLFDAVACGARIISDSIDGLELLFDGAVSTYSGPNDLKNKVTTLLNMDPLGSYQRFEIAKKIAERHSFKRRAEQLERLTMNLIEELSKNQYSIAV